MKKLTVFLILFSLISPIHALAEKPKELSEKWFQTKEAKIELIRILYRNWKEAESDVLGLSYLPVNLRKIKEWTRDEAEPAMLYLKKCYLKPSNEKERLIEQARRNLYKALKHYKTYLDLTYEAYEKMCGSVDEKDCDYYADKAKLVVAEREYHEGESWLSIAGYNIAEAESLP